MTAYSQATFMPDAGRRGTEDGRSFASTAHDHGLDNYRRDVLDPNYRLAPTRYEIEQGDHAYHSRGQTMKERLQQRKMTDVTCGCIFLFFWCGMFYTTSIALANGDPRRLSHGFDYQGRLCGVSAPVSNKTLLYWPDASRMDLTLCVEECPGATAKRVDILRETVVSQDHRRPKATTEILRQDVTLMTYPSKEVGGRYCLPLGSTPELAHLSRSILAQQEHSLMALMMNSFRDICNAWSILLFMLPVSMAVGYAYVLLLRFCARNVLNIGLAALILFSAAFSYHCLHHVAQSRSQAEAMLGQYPDRPQDVVWFIGVASALLCFLLLCSGYSMLSRTERISAVVEASSDTMWSVNFMLFMPVLEILLKAVYTVVWMCLASYVISNGDIVGTSIDVGGHRLNGLVRSFSYSTSQKMMMVFYILGYCWGLEFIGMVFKFAISFAVATWYFEPCRPDMTKAEVKPEVWQNGFTYAFYYHIGSLCVGAALSLALYIFMPIHIINEFLWGKTHTSPNPVVKAIEYSCTCFNKCTQEIVSYVNKGAIVEMVLRGDHDFFTSSGSSVRVMRNAEPSIGSLHRVTFIFQLVGVVTSAAVGAYTTIWFTSTVNIFADRNSKYFLENRIGIACTAGIISMAVSTVFMWTLDLVADSLLFCWLVEGEDDRFHERFAPKLFRNAVRFEDFHEQGRLGVIKGGGSLAYEGMHQGGGGYDGSQYMHTTGSPASKNQRSAAVTWSDTSHLTR